MQDKPVAVAVAAERPNFIKAIAIGFAVSVPIWGGIIWGVGQILERLHGH